MTTPAWARLFKNWLAKPYVNLKSKANLPTVVYGFRNISSEIFFGSMGVFVSEVFEIYRYTEKQTETLAGLIVVP